MRIKMILPALTEAKSPFWRPIKYSLFPPLGLATLAAFCAPDDEVELQDEHVEVLRTDDCPDVVVIQVYITNAWRAYELADAYRAKGCHVCLGGLHVTSLPLEAGAHGDSVFIGPGEDTFPEFLADFRRGAPKRVYTNRERSLAALPPVRRDLIRRERYLVPNSIVVSRGCPHHCDFCYKDAFFEGGKSFYTQQVDAALSEIDRLPGKHLYFLDDHLLGQQRFATGLFEGMQGMGRLFQGASTIDAILRGDLVEKAAKAGLRSIFVGFETLNPKNLVQSNKGQNLGRSYEAAIRRLHDLGIMINGSFVFGLDEDDKDVFKRTVDWAVRNGLTTATFHILTPYPGTRLFRQMEADGRILHCDWSRYDTRQVVYKTIGLTADELKKGYDRAYRDFYSWGNVLQASLQHEHLRDQVRHFTYAGGWKKFEPLWNFMIKTRGLNKMLPLLERILSTDKGRRNTGAPSPFPAIA
ncbi:MAG: B12-binding domain-containing radical SAM protein [Chitinophagaceae bacterium]|nr:MAG: B12-binding domain-containing radical SAM protein [Chitinophagaceae bacterium]